MSAQKHELMLDEKGYIFECLCAVIQHSLVVVMMIVIAANHFILCC